MAYNYDKNDDFYLLHRVILGGNCRLQYVPLPAAADTDPARR